MARRTIPHLVLPKVKVFFKVAHYQMGSNEPGSSLGSLRAEGGNSGVAEYDRQRILHVQKWPLESGAGRYRSPFLFWHRSCTSDPARLLSEALRASQGWGDAYRLKPNRYSGGRGCYRWRYHGYHL